MLDRNELILEGLAYTVMGILVVFMILVIIMMVIKAMALLSGESKPKKATQETKVVEAPVATPVVTQTADDSELIAVITAAIAAAMGQSSSGFVVRSYKAVSGNAWNKAGRMDILENRL